MEQQSRAALVAGISDISVIDGGLQGAARPAHPTAATAVATGAIPWIGRGAGTGSKAPHASANALVGFDGRGSGRSRGAFASSGDHGMPHTGH